MSLSWAQNNPITKPWSPVLFPSTDAPLLKEAGGTFRMHAPQYDVRLQGSLNYSNVKMEKTME